MGTWLMIHANDSRKEAITNSIDPDETPQNAASRQGMCYFPC